MSSAMARAGQNLASGSAHWKSDGIGTENLGGDGFGFFCSFREGNVVAEERNVAQP